MIVNRLNSCSVLIWGTSPTTRETGKVGKLSQIWTQGGILSPFDVFLNHLQTFISRDKTQDSIKQYFNSTD